MLGITTGRVSCRGLIIARGRTNWCGKINATRKVGGGSILFVICEVSSRKVGYGVSEIVGVRKGSAWLLIRKGNSSGNL